MTRGRAFSHNGYHRRLKGWSSDHNNWNDKLYPHWEEGDPRWENCWKGGRVVASLTSDSPALVGSNVTFSVTLKFPQCQREDNDSNIVYDRKCINGSSDYVNLPDQYVYNWTEWIDNCGWENCTHNNSHNVFPDGRPFPYHHDWRRRNFIYVFHTFGQYYQKTGGSSAIVSINTTNITLGKQIMEVSVYRRGYRSFVPVTAASLVYVVTDKIPFYVNMSQKNDRNASDHIFIKDIPITFEVKIHDPSHYLNRSIISYHWNYGDGSGLFVSNNSVSTHTYKLPGNFSLDLSVQAIIPAPCGPVTPSPPLPTTPAITTQLPSNMTTPTSYSTTELPTGQLSAEGCHVTRNGPYKASLFIVEGILGVNIIQMTNVQVAATQVENSMVDFVVTCQGSLPTDACTMIADPTCQVLQSEACDPVDITDECLLTIRRAFNESGTYCVNITLGDATSLALTSTLISISGAGGSFSRTAEGVLIACAFLVVVAVSLTFFLYKRYKEYKPIEKKKEQEATSEGLRVYFNNVKAVLFPANNERDPLLKSKPGII
ncbi:transmembrane glycoprotein NMB isoform X2 [Sceloporus undulatus]|nr:transmembrane glycoprotein NMB isoform X2 [Sceloporus undulatus]